MALGLLMDMWNQERSHMLELEKEARRLGKRKHALKKECRAMQANIHNFKSQVEA